MVRARVYGNLVGYAVENDHDPLHTDADFKLIADRSPDDTDLASQPTLSRLENGHQTEQLRHILALLRQLGVRASLERVAEDEDHA